MNPFTNLQLCISLSSLLILTACSTNVKRPDRALHITSPEELNGKFEKGAPDAWNNILWGTTTPGKARNSNESVVSLHISSINSETLSVQSISSDGQNETGTLKGGIQEGGFVGKIQPSNEFLYGFVNTGTERVSLWKISSRPKQIKVTRDFSFMTFLRPLPFMGNSGRLTAILDAEYPPPQILSSSHSSIFFRKAPASRDSASPCRPSFTSKKVFGSTAFSNNSLPCAKGTT
jgi:hypothetical protein